MGLVGHGNWDFDRHPDELAMGSQFPHKDERYRITYERRDEPGQRVCFGYAKTWREVKRAIEHLRKSEHAWYPKVQVLPKCGAPGHQVDGICPACGNQMESGGNHYGSIRLR